MPGKIETVTWSPPKGYELAVEVMSLSELRRRGSEEHFRRPQRVAFHFLVAVSRGVTNHVVDFTAQRSGPGCWLVLRPGQTQRFDLESRWEGLVILFRPEFLPPNDSSLSSALPGISTLLDDLPSRVRLAPGPHALCCASVRQMRRDAALAAPAALKNALLLHELLVLLLRLGLESGATRGPADAVEARLVTAFRRLVEEEYRNRRTVTWYARKLGRSERTLHRAARLVLGRSAREVISERTILEAKRLLVHSRLAVQEISGELGFDEPSNFVKVFKREVGETPSTFRAHFARP